MPPSDGPGEVLVDRESIQADVARLAARISTDYEDRPVHLIGVLKGSAVFISDLMRAITAPVTVDVISVGAYGPTIAPSGVVRIRKDLDEPIEGRDVVVVEGICASGRTLAYLLRNFQTRNPASIRVCALLAKQCARSQELTLHYVGREIPDVFVVGYGLDREERFRNLPHIARLG